MPPLVTDKRVLNRILLWNDALDDAERCFFLALQVDELIRIQKNKGEHVQSAGSFYEDPQKFGDDLEYRVKKAVVENDGATSDQTTVYEYLVNYGYVRFRLSIKQRMGE